MKTHKILKKEKKKQTKAQTEQPPKKKESPFKISSFQENDVSAKRREMIGNKNMKSCSPHNAEQCPPETDKRGKKAASRSVLLWTECTVKNTGIPLVYRVVAMVK